MKRRNNHLLLWLILVAVIIRVAYISGNNIDYIATQHSWHDTDMEFFYDWGMKISKGDVLSENVGHPHHSWYVSVSARYYGIDIKQITKEGKLEEFTKEKSIPLWDKWYHNKQFHQEPLYAYLIGAIFYLFGINPVWMYLIQNLMGIINILLIFYITKKIFSERTAYIATVIAIFAGPVMFYETIFLRTTLTTFLGLLCVYLAMSVFESRNKKAMFLFGVCSGLLVLTRATFLLFFVGTLLAYYYNREDKKKMIAVAVLGFMLALTPAMYRNIKIGAGVLTLSSIGAQSFISSNAEDYTPELGFNISNHLPEIMGKTDGNFFWTIFYTLKTHPSIYSYVRLVLRKLWMMVHDFELPNNVNYYLFESENIILKLCFISFGMIAPIGFIGMILGLKRLKNNLVMLFYIICNVMALLLFYPISRLRLPLLTALIPFAAFSICHLYELWGEKKYREFVVIIILCFMLGVPGFIPTPLSKDKLRPNDYKTMYVYKYLPVLRLYYSAKAYRDYVDKLNELIEYQPKYLKTNKRWDENLYPWRGVIAKQYAAFYFMLGDAYKEKKDEAKSKEAFESSNRLNNM